MRLKYGMNGVADPMSLRSMHWVLDMTEALVLESMVGMTNNHELDKAKREDFIDALYKPDKLAIEVNGEGYKPPPPGFEDMDAMETSFDAFIGMGAE